MDNVTFEHAGLTYANFSAEDARAAGVPEEVIAEAFTRSRHGDVRAECRRRIYAVASAETQINLAAAAALASAKTAEARSTEDTALLVAFATSVQWIADMRGTIDSLAADRQSDFLAGSSWPVCPQAVSDLVEQF